MSNRTGDEVQQHLEVQTSYLREIASFNRRHDLREALKDDEKRRAYELSDGERSSQEVVDDGDLSKSSRTVQRWWQEWIDKGLAERAENGSARSRYAAWVIDVEADDG